MFRSLLELVPLWRLSGRRFQKVDVKKIDEELSQNYYPERYCRVRIGDTLGKRYQVLGKLGWGEFSTVWFAKNIENQQWVSIKIGTRTLLKHPLHERDILRKLSEGDASHPGYSRIIHLLDSFVHEGANGQHVCLVYKAMGESLGHFQAKFTDQKLPLHLTQRVTRQLLEALDYIHQCGVIHTDIYQKNILCELDDAVVEDYLNRVPSARELAAIDPDSPIPSTGMRAPEDSTHINIRLADFGQTVHCPRRSGDRHAGQLLTMRAPEVILGLPWDSKAEIWNAACFIWEIFENRCLFDGRVLPTDKYSPQGHLREIVYHFGPAPKILVARQETMCLSSDGTIEGCPPITAPHWKEWEENLEGDEQALFFDFIGSMLKWLPEDRPTAKKALEHEWLAS